MRVRRTAFCCDLVAPGFSPASATLKGASTNTVARQGFHLGGTGEEVTQERLGKQKKSAARLEQNESRPSFRCCPNLNVAPPFRVAPAGVKPGATREIRTAPSLSGELARRRFCDTKNTSCKAYDHLGKCLIDRSHSEMQRECPNGAAIT